MPITGIGSAAAAADPVVALVAALNAATATASALASAYVPLSSLRETITYNGNGTVATVTETVSGAVTTYTYNADLTPATETRVLDGVSTVRSFSYSGGNLVGVS